MLAYPQARNASFKKHALAISLSFLFYPAAWAAPSSNALPVLGNIASGTADVTRNISQGKLTVNQQTDKLIANWNSFNVGANAQVVFNQPSTNSIALNRIGSAAASQIFGQVTANGKLILVNPNGLTIGSTGQISASSVIASTLYITDDNFNAGKLEFGGGDPIRAINNQGTIQSLNGTTTLLAHGIKNTGTLAAKEGNVNLVDGFHVSVEGHNAIIMQPSYSPSLIQSSGIIQAERINNTGGLVTIAGNTKSNSRTELAGTVNVESSQIRGQHIYITGQLDNPNSLSLDAAGSIYVNAPVNITNANQSLTLNYSDQAGQGLFFGDNGKINMTGSSAGVASKGYYYNGNAYVGGLIGANRTGTTGSLLIGNTYTSGAVTASVSHVGGLIGANTTVANATSRIFNSYAKGSISGSSETGGLIVYRNGVDNLRVDRSFWDMDNTGQPASIGGTGLSSEQMKQLSTYAGWSINSNPASSSIWYINDGMSSPALR